jgi:hypothetical protein
MRRALVGPVVACLLLVAAPALAHPFGPPPTALVSARGQSVFINWTAAPDDTLAIGVQVGLLEESVLEDVMEASVQVAPSRAQEDALNESSELLAYLVDHIHVTQDGGACEMTVQPITDFVRDGAKTVHQCPEPVSAVDIEITMLHDVHEAYRTFAVTNEYARPTQAVYSVANPRHTWDFSENEETQGGGGLPGWLPLVVIGGLVSVVGLVLAVGRSGGKG